MKAIPNWLVWRYERRQNDPNKSLTKVPYRVQPWSDRASSTNDETWSSYEDAVKRLDGDFETIVPTATRDPDRIYPRRFEGLGFVFDGSGICGIDLDGALNLEGDLDPVFKPIIDGFNGTYMERSPSKTGLHLILKTEQPYRTGGRSHGWRDDADKLNKKREVAFYFDSRFFTVTGDVFSGTIIKQFPKTYVREVLAPWINDPEPLVFIPDSPEISMDDDEIIKRALAAKNGSKFESLFKFADWEGKYASQSEADYALACLLAFWTQDPSQIRSVMEHSALNREKWVKRPDYLERTIQRARNSVVETYQSLTKKKEAKVRAYLHRWGLEKP